MQETVSTFAWLCEVRGLIYAVAEGCPSYAGNYKAVYFEDFKTIAYKKGGKWVLANKTFPLTFRGGVYGMVKSLEL